MINAGIYKKFNSKIGTSNSIHNISKSKLCTHRGRTSHTIEICYRKYDFPPHFSKSSMANNAATNDADDNESTHIQQPTTTSGSSPITQYQFEKLVALFQNSSLH